MFGTTYTIVFDRNILRFWHCGTRVEEPDQTWRAAEQTDEPAAVAAADACCLDSVASLVAGYRQSR